MRLPVHRTKIVCITGPASCSAAVLERLMLLGMNVARLKFANGTLQGVDAFGVSFADPYPVD